MKNHIQEAHNEQCDIHVVKHFYFKVNNTKLEDESNFERQVNKVIERIKYKYKIINNDISLKTGTIKDDFIYDRFRLRISVNCA
tara:strand:+ start:290 stop:541 length:252 start_codon:yes stop_codon:yes gene_type:complete